MEIIIVLLVIAAVVTVYKIHKEAETESLVKTPDTVEPVTEVKVEAKPEWPMVAPVEAKPKATPRKNKPKTVQKTPVKAKPAAIKSVKNQAPKPPAKVKKTKESVSKK